MKKIFNIFKYVNKAFVFINTTGKYFNALSQAYETFKKCLKDDGIDIEKTVE